MVKKQTEKEEKNSSAPDPKPMINSESLSVGGLERQICQGEWNMFSQVKTLSDCESLSQTLLHMQNIMIPSWKRFVFLNPQITGDRVQGLHL